MPDANPPTLPSPTGRRWAGTTGLFFDEFVPTSAWIREVGTVRLPPLATALRLRVHGEALAHPGARGSERAFPSLACFVGDRLVHRVTPAAAGPWMFECELPAAEAVRGTELRFVLGGVAWTNTLA
jgi:hypothetical protein